MLKDRLYYAEPNRKVFTARVVKAAQDTEGHDYVVLDNTAFYPTCGGQPHDTGTINGIQVLNVEEIDDEIRHTVAEHLGSVTEVEGVIDWERRLDHMQQHAGQHILSAAFVELFDFSTVSFHLGKELVSIDLDVEDVSPEQLAAAEKVANKIIFDNKPIEIKWVTVDELQHYPLRKKLAVTDEIRLVNILDYDYNGCGGTHPSSTGQVSVLKVLYVEKQRGQVRVHFVCGGRVLEQLHKKNQELTETARLLSVPAEGVAETVEKLLETGQILGKSLAEAQEVLLAFEARALLDKQHQGIVKAVYVGKTVQQLQKLAKLLVEDADDVIALLVTRNKQQLQFVAARGASVKTSMKLITEAVLPLIDGKGGGSDAFVRGGGERLVTSEQLLTAMEATCYEMVN